jgi:hypothetical protein
MRTDINRKWVNGLAAGLLIAAAGARAEDSAWVSIIPKTAALEDWTVKFEGKPVGQNPDNTFRLSPEGYLYAYNHLNFSETKYGQLYYTKRKLSYYIVRAEYNFPVEKSAPGFAEWTNQNNGLLIHTVDPAGVNGSWPTSLEVQLLGPKNTNEAPHRPSADWPVGKTANLCIPGDNIYVTTKTNPNHGSHCAPATYPDAWKGKNIPWETPWSDVAVRVLADSLVQHIIRGQIVFEYTKVRMRSGGTPLKDGYLTIQAEGTPTLFRKLDILDLEGCMDKSSPAYRTYFVKSKPSACAGTGLGGMATALPDHLKLVQEPGGLSLRAAESGTLEVADPSGRILSRIGVAAGMSHSLKIRHRGLCLVTWRSAKATARVKRILY